MKITLGEALNLRADLQISIEELKMRISENIKVQEGDRPSLSPQDLKEELFNKLDELNELIIRINNTNNQTRLDDKMFLSEALVLRESLMKKRKLLNTIIEESSLKENRYSMSEIRFINTMDIEEIQAEVNEISKSWRILDSRIQQVNWTSYLI